MATAVWDVNLAPYGFFESHFSAETPSLDQIASSSDHARYTFSNGSSIELKGEDLEFNLDGSPSEGVFESDGGSGSDQGFQL